MTPDWRTALNEERAKRGLAVPVTREPESKVERLEPEGELHCSGCDDDFPASHFRSSGNAFRYKKRLCNACYSARYGRRITTKCVECDAPVQTRENVTAPRCLKCKKSRTLARQLRPLCPCGSENVLVDGECADCYLRRQRLAA